MKTDTSPGAPLKEFVATLGGVGRLPFAPGTWGSLVALLLMVGVHSLLPSAWTYAGFTLLFSLLCVWSGSHAETIWGKDPSWVVVDEAAGMGLALALMRFADVPDTSASYQALPVLSHEAFWLIVAFLLFRVFDIVKPLGIRKLQSFNGGIGILADDLAAGAIAGLLSSTAGLLIF